MDAFDASIPFTVGILYGQASEVLEEAKEVFMQSDIAVTNKSDKISKVEKLAPFNLEVSRLLSQEMLAETMVCRTSPGAFRYFFLFVRLFAIVTAWNARQCLEE